MKKALTPVLIGLALALVQLVPAQATSISDVQLVTTSPSGNWYTGHAAGIGITDPGATNNAFYNINLNTTGELPSSGIPNGTYLAFLGYEDRFYSPIPSNDQITLTLYYTNGDPTRSATFEVGDIHTSGGWIRVSGDSGLYLGGGGFSVTPDRVGTYGNSEITPGDTIPDVVLMFSDTGPLPSSVPEPTTLLLLGLGLVALAGVKRKVQ